MQARGGVELRVEAMKAPTGLLVRAQCRKG